MSRNFALTSTNFHLSIFILSLQRFLRAFFRRFGSLIKSNINQLIYQKLKRIDYEAGIS